MTILIYIYVGSTSQPLNDRLCGHRRDATRVGNENNKLYTRMRTVGIQSWEIIPLLSRVCDIKTIRQLEQKWCKIMGADLNTLLPITTPEEKKQQKADYYESNKEAISKRNADYYKVNKEVIKQQNAEYRKSNKEAISKRNADYRESNKEAIKQYREFNKQNKVHYCTLCDKSFGSNADLQRHLKSSKHFWNYIYSVD